MLKYLIAGLLRLSILCTIFLGSCVGSGALYVQSPKWNLQPVGSEPDKRFFGAYLTGKNEGVEVVAYRFLPQADESSKITYRMPREEISYTWEGGSSATITTEEQADGSQLIRIHAVGDTPWVSLSEYRVADNEIYPLRQGAANHLFLLGTLLSPFITWFAIRPVRRIVARIVGIDREKRGPGVAK